MEFWVLKSTAQNFNEYDYNGQIEIIFQVRTK